MKTILKITTNTINRGAKLFTISVDNKGRYFAHEIGEKTQLAQIFGWEDLKAIRLNPLVRRGNKYGTYWRTKGMQTIEDCTKLIIDRANTYVMVEGIDYNVQSKVS